MTKYYSQHGEDCILDQVFNNKKTGFFIEIGAFDGIYLSNSYSFEQEGWQGICVEANPEYFDLCQKNRPNSTCIYAVCLDKQSEEPITFHSEPAGLLSGIEANREDEISRRYKRNLALEFQGFKEFKVPTTTVNEILKSNNYQGEIDFVSIDVEGSELKVLKGFDLNFYSPRVLIIEANNQEAELALDIYMKKRGYTKAIKFFCNVFYCRDKNDAKALRDLEISFKLEPIKHPLGDKYTVKRQLEHVDVSLKSYRSKIGWKTRLRKLLSSIKS